MTVSLTTRTKSFRASFNMLVVCCSMIMIIRGLDGNDELGSSFLQMDCLTGKKIIEREILLIYWLFAPAK